MSVVFVEPETADEHWKTKIIRKSKENPFVPLFTALTVGALVMATRNTGPKGNSRNLNRWFRLRIAFQGATIVAVVAGTYMMQQQQQQQASATSETDEEKRVRERLAFEARLREAEATHAEEQKVADAKSEDKRGVFEKLGLGRGSHKNREAALATPEPNAPSPSPSQSQSGGLSSWFGSSKN
ncbi:hypothetical protein PHLGIDRAFT_423124 [Phlebiopsis gigantea 11061_1 CR5-6]|uniref:HIG1 domain-containing protein n=1 Tax=Phlebiopsis gigantea (strain 11061_1 CR5-6) TaxID=745531 RepID=A0A0C3S8G8_PHLG1|nr:hypothetical protein PHLGIDRAFT_423124 [Phlebiopsis gigantea 11061_1 CR5-6]